MAAIFLLNIFLPERPCFQNVVSTVAYTRIAEPGLAAVCCCGFEALSEHRELLHKVPFESTCHNISADSAGLKSTFVGKQRKRFPARAKFTNNGTMALPTDAGCPKVTPADSSMISAATGESVINFEWVILDGTDSYGISKTIFPLATSSVAWPGSWAESAASGECLH